MTERRKILSVTLKDCEVQTFTVGGAGGQRRDKKSTGVRIIHPPSGAKGECREERSQLQYKKKAFRRMAESKEFQLCVKKQVGGDAQLIAEVEREMWPDRIKTEVKDESGDWIES